MDDTRAVPRRGVMLRVTPMGDPTSATLSHMTMDDLGRLTLPNFVTIPRRVCGHPPRWFLEALTPSNLPRSSDSLLEMSWAKNMAPYVTDATVYIPSEEIKGLRAWILPARRHATEQPEHGVSLSSTR